MKIGIMQPYFFPYIGYWQLIHAVDLFVVGDSVHYIKHGWINRNRILGEGCQPQYFGIEVSHASCNRLIYEMERVVSRKQAEYLCRVLKFYYGQVKEVCRRYGMPAIPAFRLEDEDIPFPVIVKPVDNGGSFGITVCESRKAMEEAVVKAVQNSTVGEYLCEKYLEGPCFQFEIWRQNGKSYFPYTKGRVFYDAVGQSPRQPFIDLYPSPEADIISQLYEPMSQLFDDLGVANGSCMFQGIISNGVPYIMDTALRLSGGMDFRVVREDNGIDLVTCYMQHTLTGQFGDDFSLLSEPLHGCYATICVGLKNGRINTIKGIDAVRQLPYVYSLFQYYHEGDDMQYSGIFLLVLCRIFVKADNNAEFKQHINTILCMLEVEDENGLSLLLGYPHTLNIN